MTEAHRAPTAFRPLESADFRCLEHSTYLKGLLKPFKGKGELQAWSRDCTRLRDGLINLAQRRVLAQVAIYPFTALPVHLSRQPTGAGTVFLRWRTVDHSAMGVGLWAALITDPRTPPALLPDLHSLELHRIALNMQISLVHTLARHASTCADQMAHADAVFLSRTGSVPSTPC